MRPATAASAAGSAPATDASLLIDVQNLQTHFFLDEGTVKAVDGVSLQIQRRQTLGVVGESGCGKSVTARSIMRIVDPPGRIVNGRILLHRSRDGSQPPVDLAALDPTGRQVRAVRGKEIAMIFQEPMTSFSPLYTVGNQIVEGILLHQDLDQEGARAHAIEMLDRVGIPLPSRRIDAYPHELSGGMRQRAMIAMALACNPDLLIADEPTTAVDVTIQRQILDLLRQLQAELHMAIMIITHDLGVIAELAERVIVMYWGRIVEEGDADTIFNDPKHPYTRALLESVPRIGDEQRKRLTSIEGVVPHPFERLEGCPFAPRCPDAISGVCDRGARPALVDLEAQSPQGAGKSRHGVACFLYHEQRD